MKIELKKKKTHTQKKNAYSTFSDLWISTLFTSKQSDEGGSQGWTVLGLIELRGCSPRSRGDPLGPAVSPAPEGTPLTMSMRAYLWPNRGPYTWSSRPSRLNELENSGVQVAGVVVPTCGL